VLLADCSSHCDYRVYHIAVHLVYRNVAHICCRLRHGGGHPCGDHLAVDHRLSLPYHKIHVHFVAAVQLLSAVCCSHAGHVGQQGRVCDCLDHLVARDLSDPELDGLSDADQTEAPVLAVASG